MEQDQATPEVEYVTTEELASRIHYDVHTIRNRLKDTVLFEGIHYFRPFGGRKLLFDWAAVQSEMLSFSRQRRPMIPMANGGVIQHG